MNGKSGHQVNQHTATNNPLSRGILQRQCATCGQHTIAGEECEECQKNHAKLSHYGSFQPPLPPATPPQQDVAKVQNTGFHRDFTHIPAQRKQQPVLQAKLTVGQPGDKYEQEADSMAEQVMRMPDPDRPSIQALQLNYANYLQRQPMAEEEEAVGDSMVPVTEGIPVEMAAEEEIEAENQVIQPQTVGDEVPEISPDLEGNIQALRGGGQALPIDTRQFFESRFGHDFSQVRLHNNTNAAEVAKKVHAKAFTVGREVVFGAGEYNPGTYEGQKLLAHELTHVIQQGEGASNQLIQRAGKGKKKGVVYERYQVLVPKNYTTLEQMYRLFERTVYGREMNFSWECNGYCDMSKNQGQVVPFALPKTAVEASTDPEIKKQREQHKQDYGKLLGNKKTEISTEVDKRYFELSGDKPGTKIKKDEKGKARQWEQQLTEVMTEKENLEKLPPEIKQLMGGEGNFKPKDYQQLLRIAEKLKQFAPEDFAVYKLLTIRATDNLDLFEKSVDMYLARKAELKKALEEEQKKNPSATKEPTMQDAINEQWQGLDESAIATMSEADRYQLAQQKTNEITQAQLKYMKDHPGETFKDFAKSATLMHTGETFSGIGKDLTEVANSDANTWARWAAGTGAGAKLSGWMLAVAGVLYVASWLTGIGELATIAAAAGYLLGATLVLSSVERDLRVKAASQAKTPEEFKRNVELAAAAQTNVIVGLAMIVVAAVLHFTAKALFPETMQKLSTSLKNFRERIRLKGSVFELKPEIVKEMGTRKAELAKATESAKQKALETAKQLEGLNTEQFVEKLETGDGGFLDQAKVKPDQKINYRELLKTPEGRAAIEAYKQKLVNALKTDVIASIERLAQQYQGKIDEFLKDVAAAKNHDDLNAALDKVEGTLTEEHVKKFMAEEQENITKKKLEEAAEAAQKEVIASIKDAIVKRVQERITAQSDKFQLKYTELELESIIKKGKELGLTDKVIEDLIYTGSRTAKAISAAELMQQMENWANLVSKRGFPYKFTDIAEFQRFSQDLLDGINKAGIPTDDVRIQGSSLRKPSANDVDIAVFVDQATFDKFLVDRYHQKIAFTDGKKIALQGKSHSELVQLADDIKANPDKYNAQARTFQNAMRNGIISSKSDIIKPLKAVVTDIVQKYPNLNLEAISLLIKGGLFDVKPDLPVKTN